MFEIKGNFADMRLSVFAERPNNKNKTSFMQSFAVILMCGWLVCPADAAEWSGKGEFGLVVARGNSETETLNLGLQFERKSEKWRNSLKMTALRASDDGELNAERYTLGYKSGYNFNEKSYLFGALRYDQDEFSSFDYQASLAVGYGRQLLDNDTHKLSVEIGPGVRRAEPVDPLEGTETNVIGRLSSDYAWTISETAALTNSLLVEAGSDNTFAENELALNVAINSRFALKLSGAVRHNTEVDPGVEKTDTLTTANLVYKFGEQ
jgi:putative salt-induced outer membrane protein